MGKRVVLGLAIVLLARGAAAEEVTRTVLVTRGGRPATRVVYAGWLGEYPAPVIDVASRQADGRTTLRAYASYRKLDAPFTCTIENAIYHPWSKAKGSALDFLTLVELEEYAASADGRLEDQKVKAGDVVTQVVRLPGGKCHALHQRDKRTVAPLEVECTELDKQFLKRTAGTGQWKAGEQWIHVACKEGRKAYVRDEALLKAKGASAGAFLEPGAVGPAAADSGRELE